jgi:hypothetical protein
VAENRQSSSFMFLGVSGSADALADMITVAAMAMAARFIAVPFLVAPDWALGVSAGPSCRQ